MAANATVSVQSNSNSSISQKKNEADKPLFSLQSFWLPDGNDNVLAAVADSHLCSSPGSYSRLSDHRSKRESAAGDSSDQCTSGQTDARSAVKNSDVSLQTQDH